MSSDHFSREGARPPKVRPLPDAVIDQIAAGEVVERPASVVKELVENALDADATKLRVEVRAGGRDWIAVSDDGCGMPPEDARLALQRHATSKIAGSEDLARITSYGFRGEALPAIASVSCLRLRTRCADAAEAFELRVEQGRITEARAGAGPPGTRVEVADLFANVPARRKFLKSVATEWGHIADWLARSSLALPHVHFEVRRDDRQALVWPAARNPLDRVAAVLGEDEAAAFVALEREEAGVSLRGWVSRPDRHRPTLGGVYLFVNGRSVRDRLIQHAIVDVYRDLLPRGRFPSAVLYLSLASESVDVNVHPAKWEVRFADPPAVHGLVRHALRGAVAERRWLGAAAAPQAPARASIGSGDPRARAAAGEGDWIFAGAGRSDTAPAAAPLPGLSPEACPASAIRFGDLRLLGQLLATYLVLESKDALLLVDQHAAHERVLYERLRAEWRRGWIERQGLLVPVTLALAPAPLQAVTAAASTLEEIGFEVEPFGEDHVVVRAVPSLLVERDAAGLVRDLADELAAAGPAAEALREGRRGPEAAEGLFAQIACHSARRKGDVLEATEQRALLDAVDGIPWAPSCPHGRPVAVPLDLAEIERRFARR